MAKVKLTQSIEACREEILGKEILEKLGKLGFKTVHCHETASLTHNTVYIFSSIYDSEQFISKMVEVDGFSKKTIDLAIPELWKKYGVKSASLDVAEQFEDYKKALNTDIVNIIYTECKISDTSQHGTHNKGIYDPCNNILILPDITHNHKDLQGQKATCKRVGWLLDQLIEYQANNAMLMEKAQQEIEEAITSFVMGADIEFEVFEGDEFVGADRFYPSLYEDIGRDGHRETGELRPKPSKDPIKLAKNTKELLETLHNQMPKGYKICAGSGRKFPIGLHIHFSGILKDKTLLTKLGFTLNDILEPFQSDTRRSAGYGKTTDIRDQPHGWEWRALWSTIEDYEMLESIYCVAYGTTKAHLLNVNLGTDRIKAYKQLPNYDVHKKQIDHFIDRFITHKFIPIDGKDIRPNWFDYMPEHFAIRRYKFLDDDRMEWLYSGLEERRFDNMLCNWIIICLLGGYNAPDIVTLGIPKAILKKALAKCNTDLKFGIGIEKIPVREMCFSINLPVTKRAVVDPIYRKHVLDTISTVIQEMIIVYKELHEAGKNPTKCNTFKGIWVGDRTSRNNYRTDKYELLDGSNDGLPDLKVINEKDLAILAILYKENPDAMHVIFEEIKTREKQYKVKIRGQYDH